MTGNDVSVGSVEVPLLSEIGNASATSIRGAYLPPHDGTGNGPGVAPVQPDLVQQGEGPAGPNALVYASKLSSRTPVDVIESLLSEDPDRNTMLRTHDFHTVVLTLSMWLGDPATTHLINGTIDLAFPPEVTILDYSPKDKGTITTLIENGGGVFSIHPGLDLLPPPARSATIPSDSSDCRFRVPAGPHETLNGTYNRKTGYSLDLPVGSLLEYQGMITSPHEIFWEIYPPMPPAEHTMTGIEMLAVFSLIVRTPRNQVPEIRAHIDCRVKGNLWGVIPLRGSAVFP